LFLINRKGRGKGGELEVQQMVGGGRGKRGGGEEQRRLRSGQLKKAKGRTLLTSSILGKVKALPKREAMWGVCPLGGGRSIKTLACQNGKERAMLWVCYFGECSSRKR